MSENFRPLGETERIRLIRAALEFCGEKVTMTAIQEQFKRETGEYPKSGSDKVETPPHD